MTKKQHPNAPRPVTPAAAIVGKDVVMGYLAATAISAVVDAAEALNLELTNGYNTRPRNPITRRASEDLCSAISTYHSIVGGHITQRIHQQHCGHPS
jgi:hypothetical protein